MKGSIRFDNDINIEVDVDKSAAEGAKLTSAVNLVDGQELGGGGGGDFSTCQGTINNITPNNITIDNPNIDTQWDILTSKVIAPRGTHTFTFVLYKGKGTLAYPNVRIVTEYSGAYDPDTDEISGDFAVTIDND